MNNDIIEQLQKAERALDSMTFYGFGEDTQNDIYCLAAYKAIAEALKLATNDTGSLNVEQQSNLRVGGSSPSQCQPSLHGREIKTCKTCGAGFKTRERLDNHTKIEHDYPKEWAEALKLNIAISDSHKKTLEQNAQLIEMVKELLLHLTQTSNFITEHSTLWGIREAAIKAQSLINKCEGGGIMERFTKIHVDDSKGEAIVTYFDAQGNKIVEPKTLRDEFAIAALTSIIAFHGHAREHAKTCYEYADSMMKAREMKDE